MALPLNFSGEILLSDERKLPYPFEIISSLPQNSIFIDRNFISTEKSLEIKEECKKHNVFYFISSEYIEYLEVIIPDGINLTSKDLLKNKSFSKEKYYISASCHSKTELSYAEKLKVDFALLSPLFSTTTHNDAEALGVQKFSTLITNIKIPIIALGGINKNNIKKLEGLNIRGFAAISYFI